jgi:CBS domain containing-hemolysin-like protein
MLTLLILFFAISIVFSFLCSMWEAVLLSITPTYARIKLQEGASIGRHLASFKENIDRPLAAILTLNTIAHTVGAIGVGAQATTIWHDSHPMITAFAVPVVMTLAILILSEIIPKTIGANYWHRLAGFTVASLRLIIAVLWPLVQMSQLITRALNTGHVHNVLSRTDFLTMAEIGAEEGVFDEEESEIIANLLRFHAVRAKDVMTPRTVLVTAAEDMTLREFHEQHPDLRFSRIPVYAENSKDRITGYVLKDTVLASLVEENDGGEAKRIGDIKREILLVAETFPIPDLFARFIRDREHIALVVDEFGGTAGIVTMEDVIETLIGIEIVDEMDHTEDMQLLARRSWEQRARALGLVEPRSEPEAPKLESPSRDEP